MCLEIVVEIVAYGGAFDENGAQGDGREIDLYGESRCRTGIGDTAGDVEVAGGHEGAFAMDLFLFGSGLVTVCQLAAEFEHGTVRPVFGEVERRGCFDPEFVLIFEPHAGTRSRAVFVGRFDLHAVVSEFGADFRIDGEFLFFEDMVEVEGSDRCNGVVTARHIDPRFIERGQCSLQGCGDFEVIAFFAYCGAFGAVFCQRKGVAFDLLRADRIGEIDTFGSGLHAVDRDLCGGGKCEEHHGGQHGQRELIHGKLSSE